MKLSLTKNIWCKFLQFQNLIIEIAIEEGEERALEWIAVKTGRAMDLHL